MTVSVRWPTGVLTCSHTSLASAPASLPPHTPSRPRLPSAPYSLLPPQARFRPIRPFPQTPFRPILPSPAACPRPNLGPARPSLGPTSSPRENSRPQSSVVSSPQRPPRNSKPQKLSVVESPRPSLGLVDVRVSGLRPAVLTHPKPQTVRTPVRRGEAAIVARPF